MKRPANLWTAWYLANFGLAARYHRYEIDGLDTLLQGRACMIVGYHGRPIAWDVLFLAVELYKRLGYLPHGLIHGSFKHGPAAKMVRDLGFVFGDTPELQAAIERGEHMLVAPGGTREGCRSFRHRYQVDWDDKCGYLRIAAKYRLPIVPVAADGVDDVFEGLNNGDALGKVLQMPAKLPFWFGFGPLGLWPLSPPFPVKVRQRIGQPLDLFPAGAIDPGDKAALLAAHRSIGEHIQLMLNDLRAGVRAH